jgi:CheY-like chemotaxis protein
MSREEWPAQKDVLVVDDNPINQVYFCAALRKGGYDILSATSGPEALHLAEQNLFQLILMDIRMPEMDGYQTVRALRAGPGRNRQTPVVAISAEELDKQHRELFEDFLIKPVAKQQLLALVSRFMTTHHSLSEPLPESLNLAPSGRAGTQALSQDPAAGTETDKNPAIDHQHGMAAVGHDAQIAQRLQAMLKKELPGQLIQLHALHAGHDVAGLRELLHLMVGSASFCGALSLAQRLREYSETIKSPASSSRQWQEKLEAVELAAGQVLNYLD